jgi:hypothetical protein
MLVRVCLVAALVCAASAAKAFKNPHANLDTAVPGGYYVQKSVPQGPKFTFLEGPTTAGYCPEIQFFGDFKVYYQTHKDACLVKFSAVTWSGNQPEVHYFQDVVGSTATVADLDTDYDSKPCYFTVNGVEYEFDGSQIVNQAIGCANPLLLVNQIDETSMMHFYAFHTDAARPIGPLALKQKSNGDILVSTAVLISLGITLGPQEQNIEGMGDVDYTRYNWGIAFAEGDVPGDWRNAYAGAESTINNAIPSVFSATFKINYYYRFKGRDTTFEYLAAEGLTPLSFELNAFQDRYGRNVLRLSTGNDGGTDDMGDAFYEYVQTRKDVSLSQFRKNQIDAWFGGRKMRYFPPRRIGNAAGRLPAEKSRRRHRKSKRKVGKRSSNRDNLRFKLPN